MTGPFECEECDGEGVLDNGDVCPCCDGEGVVEDYEEEDE